MTRRGRWVLGEDGKWREGKAKPALLREDLRALPSEYLTNDPADGSKIHELDAPHIVEALQDDIAEEQQTVDPMLLEGIIQLADAPLSEPVVPLNQWRVDAVRLRVALARIENAWAKARKGEVVDLEVCHIRFPRNNVHEYSFAPGKPPRDKKLRPHERGLKLWVDPFAWTEIPLARELERAGFKLPDLSMEESQYRAYRLKLSERRMKDAGL